MTTNNEQIKTVCDELVAVIRADVKAQLYERFKAEFDFQTGMHGEPINQAQPKTRGQRGKDRRPFRPNSPLARIYRTLASRKHGVNIRTLCRETGCDNKAVQNAIHRLRRHGYNIVCNRAGYRLPKYRLAS